MTTKEMIETLRYKAENIKAKIEPEFFNEVADRLEKQIAKKTKIYNDEYFDMFDCPNCKETFDAWEGYSYCPECGQKLDLELDRKY